MATFSGNWREKIANPHQVGGIETSVLDNGPGSGNRIAWVNTGSGLRYKVILDRAMDIGEAFFQQYGLAWMSFSGHSRPQPLSDQGTFWLRTFGGGLLTTCGLSHVGGPEMDEFGQRGLHGRISNIPAELYAIKQPDPLSGKMDMSITGRIRESQVLGTHLALTRTISGQLGKPCIYLKDTVSNYGNQPAPLMLLYHLNLGWPLVDEGARLFWEGDWQSRESPRYRMIFREDYDFFSCPAPLPQHNGPGEEACFIDPVPDYNGFCTCGISNALIGIKLNIRFKKSQLPCLTNWQHWGLREYVTGLEPGTNHPTGQDLARKENKLTFLNPGESKIFELTIEVQAITDQ